MIRRDSKDKRDNLQGKSRVGVCSLYMYVSMSIIFSDVSEEFLAAYFNKT